MTRCWLKPVEPGSDLVCRLELQRIVNVHTVSCCLCSRWDDREIKIKYFTRKRRKKTSQMGIFLFVTHSSLFMTLCLFCFYRCNLQHHSLSTTPASLDIHTTFLTLKQLRSVFYVINGWYSKISPDPTVALSSTEHFIELSGPQFYCLPLFSLLS